MSHTHSLCVVQAPREDRSTQRIGRIRSALALDVALTLPEIIKQADRQMGIEGEGSLPAQANRLVVALGLQ